MRITNKDYTPLAGDRAYARVQALFTWQRKADQIAEIYAWLLGRRPDRPCFFGERDGTVAGQPAQGGTEA